ncbi:latent-transforming growth factor beta-binding protein 4-like [Haliotis cracherodii]|uniref:latent-transforming growth factor beta-binding protein 4-like n=1 Tax=Haliotis cracherodii TaxID=6455 RepID=UPI0039EBD3C4
MAPVMSGKVFGLLFVFITVVNSATLMEMLWSVSECQVANSARKCYSSVCPTGWTSDPPGGNNYLLCYTGICCIQIDDDECTLNTHDCHSQATCSNTIGSFTCACNAGFTGDGKTCVDTNECATNNGGCDSNARCDNTVGSFICTCNTGFTGNGFSCTDVNECATNNGGCDGNARCDNTVGSFTCTCNTGFTGNGFSCTDINECLSGTDNCGTDAICTNNIGSFSCACPNGYTGTPTIACTDINECAANTDTCQANSVCSNTAGSYTCDCLPGYTGNGFVGCTDLNECGTNNGGCDSNARCDNTVGSFTCTCNSGYTGSGDFCININECDIGSHTCVAPAVCIDNPGSYTCGCPAGYTGDPAISCQDINECNTNNGGCDGNARCDNTDGSFTCTCNSGFSGNGFNCFNNNECLNTNLCGANANCVDTFGSYACVCFTGFSGNGNVGCTDVNECATNNGGCDDNADCANTVGSFTCTCQAGFSGDGSTCTNINECAAPNINNCDSAATCSDTFGSYTCTCNFGYTGDGFTCTDVNECDISGTCHAEATCVNQPGTYTCTCDPGYTGDGVTCTNVNECSNAATFTCAANANCVDTIGSYTCVCQAGYTGDGKTSCIVEINHPDCGTVPTPQIRIGFSEEEQKCISPWQVSFRRFADTTILNQEPSFANSQHQGAGILIQGKWVLTTAFALIRAGRRSASDPFYSHTLFASVGDHNIFENNGDEQYIRIKNVTFHPLSRFQITTDFFSLILTGVISPAAISLPYQEFSYALVELEREVTLTDCARPACIPIAKEYPEKCGSPTCKITGWGTSTDENLSGVLQKAEVQVFDFDACEALSYYRNNQVPVVQPLTTKCAINGTGASPCNGDFGGGVICRDDATGKYVADSLTMMEMITCSSDPTSSQFNIADIRQATDWIEKIFRENP